MPKFSVSMKKIYTIVWLLMTSLVLSAAEISQEQALVNVRSFVHQKSGGSLIQKRVQRSTYTNNKSKETVEMQGLPASRTAIRSSDFESGYVTH